VTQLPDVEIPAVDVPPVLAPVDGGADTEVVEGFTIPAQVVDAGCVIRYDAPGGCLGAVEITGATIPAVAIPRSVLPASELAGGGEVGEVVFDTVTADAVTADRVFVPEACQVEHDGEVPSVTREGVVRKGVARNGLARPGGVRPGRCDDDDCVPEVRVPTVRLAPVRLPAVDVDPARLESRELRAERRVDVLVGAGETAYVAPGDVLFDSEQATIRPDAARALRAIAAKLRATASGKRLLVEGHTDDRGSESYGMALSERRARAVADWLAERAGLDRARITTRGLGETAPVVPNTSAANRQRNRRVVITVGDK
jgi:outer membrane protein OmpA-like peptidoglycan-associated protein